MGEQNWLDRMNERMWMEALQETNRYAQKYGLRLSEADAEMLLAEKKRILKNEGRVELGESILPRLIYTFCDSSFISQDNYTAVLTRLQEIFFEYKNEMQDEITDEELLNFMKEQFEGSCFGDLDYLEGTCLEIFGEAIRAGYRGYQTARGKGEFEKMDIVQRWDRELYIQAQQEFFG